MTTFDPLTSAYHASREDGIAAERIRVQAILRACRGRSALAAYHVGAGTPAAEVEALVASLKPAAIDVIQAGERTLPQAIADFGDDPCVRGFLLAVTPGGRIPRGLLFNRQPPMLGAWLLCMFAVTMRLPLTSRCLAAHLAIKPTTVATMLQMVRDQLVRNRGDAAAA